MENRRILLYLLFILLAFSTTGVHAQTTARSLYSQGFTEQMDENYLRAIELYRKALEINPDYMDPHFGLARCFYELNQYDEALANILMARKYDSFNVDLFNLEADIRASLGQLEEARQLYEGVLEAQPNNLDARFGIARLDLADGRKSKAASGFLETLKAAPGNVRALLSLALLYEDMGDEEAAAVYLEQALRSHPEEPSVYLTAGRYAMDRGRLGEAAEYLLTALSLKPNYDEARQLLGNLYLLNGRPAEAAGFFRENLSSLQPDYIHIATYSLGVAYGEMADHEEAMRHFASALRQRPEDEITRISAENLAGRYPEETDAWRTRFAEYHHLTGREFEIKNRLPDALYHYRRSLQLKPDWPENRLSYANIFRMLGYPLKYLMELYLLRDFYGYSTTRVRDDIEILRTDLDESLASQWRTQLNPLGSSTERVDPYDVSRNGFSLGIFSFPRDNRLIHPLADRDITRFLEDLLLRYDTLSIAGSQPLAEGFDEVFSLAREWQTDFFLVVEFEETERSFRCHCSLYLTRTGSLLEEFTVFRSGNRRVTEALLRISEQVYEAFPVHGSILARRFDEGLINLGSRHGLAPDQRYLIIKKGRLGFGPNSLEFLYKPDDVLGTLTVSTTDESLSAGVIEARTFFDNINPGDLVIVEPPKISTEE